MSLSPEDACPATAGDLYDYIVFDGHKSPGVVTLSGHVREQSLDVKESDGQKGATTTWKGTKIGKFTATFELVSDGTVPNDFTEWDEFAEYLWSTIPPKSGAKPVAKDVEHPDLERNDYKSVILGKMGEMKHDRKGGGTISVDFSEYFPPKPAKASGAAAKKGGGDPEIDAARAALAAAQAAGKKP